METIDLELGLARNMLGKLGPDVKERLVAAVKQPTLKTWDDAFSIIIGSDGWMTLWQAVIAIDPTFPRTGKTTDMRGKVIKEWATVPTREVLIRALKYATH